MNKVYLCIDLKSFYASVECVDRGLDPLVTNLVVADNSRTEKTICLAVTPALKSFGIAGRARLFEVVQKVRDINIERRRNAKSFIGKSFNLDELNKNIRLELDYIVAPPRMAHYIEVSSKIYNIYLKYISSENIHVYSIDEVFIDITNYLKSYKMTPYELAKKMISDVYKETGITATAGIGTNLYLAKIAMDIMAKKVVADKDGVRIAYLDEEKYRNELWDHTPLRDFWRVGPGYCRRLETLGIKTMGDIALCSIENEDLLYKLFGINAELLIDHAWGYEPCTISHIKNYQPRGKSYGTGQVLHEPYDYKKARLIVREMIDNLSLDLLDKGLYTSQLVLTVGYDIENVNDSYQGEIVTDYLGRKIPKHSHGTCNLKCYTASTKLLTDGMLELYDRIINKDLSVRRINIAATKLSFKETFIEFEQLDLFDDNNDNRVEKELLNKEKKTQKAILEIKKKFGKNAIMKGMNLEEGATMKERNDQIGGHKA